MTANWFEAKVKYVKVGEDGKEKKMSELYLLDAMSYTEAESRITENLREMIQGDFYIVIYKIINKRSRHNSPQSELNLLIANESLSV